MTSTLCLTRWILTAVLAWGTLTQMVGVSGITHAASASATASATIIAPVAIGTSAPQVSPTPGKPTWIVIKSTGGLSGNGSTGGSGGGSVSGGAASADTDTGPNGYTITIDGDKTYAITMPSPIVVAEANVGQSIDAEPDTASLDAGGLLAPHAQTVLIAGTLMASLSQAQERNAGGFTLLIEYN